MSIEDLRHSIARLIAADLPGFTPEEYLHAARSVSTLWREKEAPQYKVSRDGAVSLAGRVLGYVDRYDQSRANRIGTDWRAMKEGGRTATSRFATRDAAAEWVVTP